MCAPAVITKETFGETTAIAAMRAVMVAGTAGASTIDHTRLSGGAVNTLI